jgi:hypothetical protein
MEGYNGDQGHGSLGVIARDHAEKFVGACCKDLLFVADAFMGEAYALREGLSLAHFLGCNKIVIQPDNS